MWGSSKPVSSRGAPTCAHASSGAVNYKGAVMPGSITGAVLEKEHNGPWNPPGSYSLYRLVQHGLPVR